VEVATDRDGRLSLASGLRGRLEIVDDQQRPDPAPFAIERGGRGPKLALARQECTPETRADGAERNQTAASENDVASRRALVDAEHDGALGRVGIEADDVVAAA
jgi:hypothetical protein